MGDPRTGRPRPGARLGPADRLKTGWEYRRVYDRAQARHGRLLVVFVLADEAVVRRAGFVAGRKVGGAVQRNRARRLLREAWRGLKQEYPPTGTQIVFVAKKGCAEQSLDAITREMSRLLSRAGLPSGSPRSEPSPPGPSSP
jgi:ribonuclease P protein component